ncbi:MAG: PF20097 family protein [Cellulosilyticaceae bacterium]
MNCAACGEPLERGKLKFSDKLKWVPEKKRTLLESLIDSESIVLSSSSVQRFQSTEAYCCPKCRMVIIKY